MTKLWHFSHQTMGGTVVRICIYRCWKLKSHKQGYRVQQEIRGPPSFHARQNTRIFTALEKKMKQNKKTRTAAQTDMTGPSSSSSSTTFWSCSYHRQRRYLRDFCSDGAKSSARRENVSQGVDLRCSTSKTSVSTSTYRRETPRRQIEKKNL